MRVADALLAAQAARFERLDPLLPPAVAPPDGDVLTAALPDGERVAGVLTRANHPAGSAATLWSPAQVWELHPLVGDVGGAGTEALLREWRRVLDRVPPGVDSACTVTWPSRDVEAAGPLLRHGFVPLTILAVRVGAAGEVADEVAEVADGAAGDLARDATDSAVSGGAGGRAEGVGGDLVVRVATGRDLDVVLELELAELAYSAQVGAAIVRADARQVRRAALVRHLEQGDPVWLAEQGGVVVGAAHCRVVEVGAGSAGAGRLPVGRWGYVNSVSVRPEVRGAGVGRRLMDVAHRGLRQWGAGRTFLYFNPPNPLSPGFWARQGYRPLWTIWEVRPAGAMR